uniref:Uncharacterized protein n=1 Tax=Arundo donax TaxID=35708 RepID=A0A0A9B7F1_ARUDO
MSPSLAAETSRSPVAEQPKESPIMPKSPMVPLPLPPEREKMGIFRRSAPGKPKPLLRLLAASANSSRNTNQLRDSAAEEEEPTSPQHAGSEPAGRWLRAS